ncbi:MAG: type 2 isopentenyl-diphosphate Delta-isomerase, partial [Promethearchaeota archaeon]
MNIKQNVHVDRKLDHLMLISENGMQSDRNWMDEITIHPQAIPRINYKDIELAREMFGRRFQSPIFIAAMTGGHPKAKLINKVLAKACDTMGIPIGLGSQRVAFNDKDLIDTFRIAREVSEDLFIIGNIGMSQLAKSDDPVALARSCVEMIDANALAVHFNKLQELVQLEGDRDNSNILEIVKILNSRLKVPIILKEVGMGFSRADYKILSTINVEYVDVGGYGGTNFSLVEAARIDEKKYPFSRNLGKTFKECGTPTPVSIILARKYKDFKILATGGIRTGLDVVKAICLGASMCGIAYPFLLSALNDIKENNDSTSYTIQEIQTLNYEI